MAIANEKNISVVYSGDETTYRSKTDGMSLMDQFFLSIASLRQNWSPELPVYFIHTLPLSDSSLKRMDELLVTTIKSDRLVHPDFLMANKMLVQLAPIKTAFTLFLDNDTFVHKPVDVDVRQIMVAYDVLQSLPENDFKQLFNEVGVVPPTGEYVRKPALEYYMHNRMDTFPAWNSGVYVIETSLLYDFCQAWEEIFLELFSRYIGEKWSFYLEQALFCVTVFLKKLDFDYFPKGYNFICTPRATELEYWPHEEIIIEHYAGNTSRPLKNIVKPNN